MAKESISINRKGLLLKVSQTLQPSKIHTTDCPLLRHGRGCWIISLPNLRPLNFLAGGLYARVKPSFILITRWDLESYGISQTRENSRKI